MIRNPDFPDPAEIIKMFASGEILPQKLGTPATQAERIEAAEGLQHILEENGADGIRTICIGCGNDTPLLQSVACICGGWVCEHCQAIEEDGVCDHTPHVLPEGADDD